VSARTVRVIVAIICVGGVAGMIASTITHHDGAALTFGIITAIAILCSMVATAVTRGPSRASITPEPALGISSFEAHSGDFEAEAARLEAAVDALVEAGTDEPSLRDLVRLAVRLGRADTIRSRP